MVQIHEGLKDGHTIRLGRGLDAIQFIQGQRQGLFAEHVLARFGGPDRPFGVEVVGQRVVDDVDAGIGQQFFIAAVGLGNIPLGRIGLGALQIPAGDGGQFAPGRFTNGLDQRAVDVGGRQKRPTQGVAHEFLLFCG